MKLPLLLSLFAVFTQSLIAQQERPLELIVHWPKPADLRQTMDGLAKRQALSQSQATELLVFEDRASRDKAWAQLPAQVIAQANFDIDFRRTPNDELYDSQPNLDRLNLPRLWEESTGGTTSDGDEIVVAILDSGFDTRHEDLVNNLWRNTAEIADDGIDNDNNGYIDDLVGWSFTQDRPTPSTDNHGTSVIGIIGAESNNDIGVSGVNWNTSMMLFQVSDVASIIAAYDYVIDQRQKWQNSNGAEGAFVVVTNASFGLEGQRCVNFPVWAMQYDRLGEAGILTAAATANMAWDVDDVGDMPTSCPTEFIISIANSDATGNLFRQSAWGRTSVDLSAPGEGSYTTSSNNTYNVFGNTSAAAPYVAGTVALLYSQDCDRLKDLTRQNPSAAALLIREAILSSTQPVEFLDRLVATGGILDSWAAWRKLEVLCNPDGESLLSIEAFAPNPAREFTEIWFDTPRRGPYELRLFDALGREARRYQLEALPPAKVEIDINGLAVGIYSAAMWDGEDLVWSQLIIQ